MVRRSISNRWIERPRTSWSLGPYEKGTILLPSDHIILPKRNIVYIRQTGTVTFAEAIAGFDAWCADPRYRPEQNWLMDCSTVTQFDTDPILMMSFQARALPSMLPATDPALIVLYTPHPGPGRNIAMGVLKTWDGLGRRLPRLTETEAESLDILGQPERSFAELLAVARPQATSGDFPI